MNICDDCGLVIVNGCCWCPDIGQKQSQTNASIAATAAELKALESLSRSQTNIIDAYEKSMTAIREALGLSEFDDHELVIDEIGRHVARLNESERKRSAALQDLEEARSRLRSCLELLRHASLYNVDADRDPEWQASVGALLADAPAVEGQETCRNCGKPVSTITAVARKGGKPICFDCFYVPIEAPVYIGFDMASGPDKTFYRCKNCNGVFDAPLAHECRVVEERGTFENPVYDSAIRCDECRNYSMFKASVGLEKCWTCGAAMNIDPRPARAVEKRGPCPTPGCPYADGPDFSIGNPCRCL